MRMPFVKMHGAGNDFIIVDNRPGYLSGTEHELIRQLCDRHTGIGADGLMLITPGKEQDFLLQYFNADGYPAAICGNGARCAVLFAWQQGWVSHTERVTFATEQEHYQARIIHNHRVAIQFPLPTQLRELPEIAAAVGAGRLWAVHAGVPHVVALMSQLPDAAKVLSIGRWIRNHAIFQPEGTNVNFIVQDTTGALRARVYERGVEAETLACGTGALACGWVAQTVLEVAPPVQVAYPGGVLQVYTDAHSSTLWLEGPVAEVFQGSIALPQNDGEFLT